jgi:hypothetical protein
MGAAVGSDGPVRVVSAFVTFAPGALEPEDAEIDLSDCKVFLTGCCPIYESERQFIHTQGLEEFWKLDWDVMEVSRPPVA